jgi:hypothetical protein
MASSLTPREEAAQHEAEQSFAQLLSAVKQVCTVRAGAPRFAASAKP